jgi:methionyl-tRNA formyltransferase
VKIALAAEEAAGVQVLRNILALSEPPDVAAVLTTPPEVASRRPVVYEAAVALGLTTLPSSDVRDPAFAARLRSEDVDLLLNVHSLHVVHPEVVAAPRVGCFNLHPGPLPEYAGLNVPSWAISRGERAHGVTVHWMDGGIDTGPIAFAVRFEIADDETGLSLSAKCVRRGVPLVVRLVETAIRDPRAIPRDPQDIHLRCYFGAGPPLGGRVDWSRPAVEISRFVRAADYGPFPSPWGRVRAEVDGQIVTIAKAGIHDASAVAAPGTVVEITQAGHVIATGDGSLLVELSA